MLERKIADAKLNGRLTLEGRVNDMGEWYHKAAVFVLTSRFEGLPMVLLEAKAHRLPIVSFDCLTGPSDVVDDGENGDLVAEGDIDGMAAKLAALMDDSEQRQRYSDCALQHAERFDKDYIVRQWKALFTEIGK